jgi:hypothetical protein
MRFSVHRLLPVVFLAAFACSPQSSPESESASTPVAAPSAAPPALPDTLSQTAAPVDTADVHDVAAYLAGLPVKRGSSLSTLTNTPEWQAFRTDADKSWSTYHASRTDKIEAWAKAELDTVRQNSPVLFYPFSGPDFLNAATVFPGSDTYVLVGLEPVGSVPGRTSLESPKLYNAVKSSLWSVLNFSFFRTNSMAVDLKSLELDGAVPLIMLFAARTNHQITDVQHIYLSKAGELAADTATNAAQYVPGAIVSLRTAQGKEKKVYYFSADLSDWKLGQTNSAILRYTSTLGPLTTYVKSATYLMHKPYFSKVRNLILERSRYILQDDSGIAMKYFQPANWRLTHYGTYRKPIPMFSMYYQPALTAAYQDTINKPRVLPFGTGYNWRVNDSNLLLAKRRQVPVS